MELFLIIKLNNYSEILITFRNQLASKRIVWMPAEQGKVLLNNEVCISNDKFPVVIYIDFSEYKFPLIKTKLHQEAINISCRNVRV